ncbi:hypothetical protein HMPREF0322_02443 [Desulfitobacterium hafniense DP7]|uniref:Uncharacterized protein n=1 Tax=Desulfitobacterium hafniense DP7 TaxID=537010 RepID=G9XNA1_DESHA|nr:hypothetical protein HMPREF0322_02443 [Desulfitobacterium hafniense DP7]
MFFLGMAWCSTPLAAVCVSLPQRPFFCQYQMRLRTQISSLDFAKEGGVQYSQKVRLC